MSRRKTIYERALILLPRAYRDRYGQPMAQMLEDMLADQSRWTAKKWILFRAMLDLPITATQQYAQLGGATMNQLPKYAKRNTMISAGLLAPFFALVAINTVRPLEGFGRSIGYLGIFVLPVVALLVGVLTLVRLLANKRLSLDAKRLRASLPGLAMFAIPLLALIIVGFAYGHDSVHILR